jgi:hypothetical protein
MIGYVRMQLKQVFSFQSELSLILTTFFKTNSNFKIQITVILRTHHNVPKINHKLQHSVIKNAASFISSGDTAINFIRFCKNTVAPEERVKLSCASFYGN